MIKIFGTDGIRCKVNQEPMTAETCLKIAKTTGYLLSIDRREKKRVVIFAGGTGNPYFTTDTTASLRASEIKADCILKATNVDGVYSSDPNKNPDAEFIPRLTYIDVLNRQLGVMDTTAVSLCMDNNLPIIVFNLLKKGNICRVVNGENVGTVVASK